MFKDTKAFSSFSVPDIGAAKQFYGETLGLDVRDTPMGVIEIHGKAGWPPVTVYPKPDHKPAVFTVLNFPVDDVEVAVDKLVSTGVRFESYNMPQIKTDSRGISRDNEGTEIAWFKDPAGNILSVIHSRAD